MNPNEVKTLLKMMEIAVSGEVNDTFERYVFRHRLQKEDESFDQYINELRELRKRCDFCSCMEDKLLKDQVITGIRNSVLRERLLQKRGLSLAKCLDMCRASESASSQAKEMAQAAAPTTAEVNRIDKTQQPRQYGPRFNKPKCKFCG